MSNKNITNLLDEVMSDFYGLESVTDKSKKDELRNKCNSFRVQVIFKLSNLDLNLDDKRLQDLNTHIMGLKMNKVSAILL